MNKNQEYPWVPIRSADDLPKEPGTYLASFTWVGTDVTQSFVRELGFYDGRFHHTYEFEPVAWGLVPEPYRQSGENEGKDKDKPSPVSEPPASVSEE